jgi:hypothetical protein
VASTVGAVTATTLTATVVYAATPLAMVSAAEGAGLLARRIVIRTTGVDAEAQRRGAATVQRLAYQQARAERHPDRAVRWIAARRSWRLARRVGRDDTTLGTQLVGVQRACLTASADTALAGMFGAGTPTRDALTTPGTPELPTGTPHRDTVPDTRDTRPDEHPVRPAQPPLGTPDGAFAGTPVPTAVTQVSAAAPPEPGHPRDTPGTAVTVAELAAVAGVPAPATGVPLDDDQLLIVLRWLRHQDNPPLSYRQAAPHVRRRPRLPETARRPPADPASTTRCRPGEQTASDQTGPPRLEHPVTSSPEADELRIRHYLRDLQVAHTPTTPDQDWWTALYPDDTPTPDAPDPEAPSRWETVRDRITTWGERHQDPGRRTTGPATCDDYPHDHQPAPTGERPKKHRPKKGKQNPAVAWARSRTPRVQWAASTLTGAACGYTLGLQPVMAGWLAGCGHAEGPGTALVLAAGLIGTGSYAEYRTRHWWPPIAWASRIPLATAILTVALYAPGATT